MMVVPAHHLPPAHAMVPTFPLLQKYDYFPTITNIVATNKMSVPLSNFTSMAQHGCNLEYTAQHPSAVAIRSNRILCRYYTSSEEPNAIMVLAACKTYYSALYEAHRLSQFVASIPTPVMVIDSQDDSAPPWLVTTTLEAYATFEHFKIVNVVAAGVASERPLNLMSIVAAFRETGYANWEPDKFPGAKLILVQSPECPLEVERVTIHLFDTGKNVIMGAHTVEDVFLAQHFIRKFVQGHVDPNLPDSSMLRNSYRKNRMLHGMPRRPPPPVNAKAGDDGDDDAMDIVEEEEELLEEGVVHQRQGQSLFHDDEDEDDEDAPTTTAAAAATHDPLDSLILSLTRRRTVYEPFDT